jgi:hypothetical protein
MITTEDAPSSLGPDEWRLSMLWPSKFDESRSSNRGKESQLATDGEKLEQAN